MTTLCPWPLTFWTQHLYALPQCRGLLLCQVSSYFDQGFSFYRANITAHPHTYVKRIPTYNMAKWSHYLRRRTTLSARTMNSGNALGGKSNEPRCIRLPQRRHHHAVDFVVSSVRLQLTVRQQLTHVTICTSEGKCIGKGMYTWYSASSWNTTSLRSAQVRRVFSRDLLVLPCTPTIYPQ